MTKPSAPSPKGRLPVALSAPIFENLTKEVGPMFRSTPPVMTASHARFRRRPTAASRAARLDAQAASVVKFGPWRPRRFATRPAMMFASSPGIVSSVTGGSDAPKAPLAPRRISACISGGSSRNFPAWPSAFTKAGRWIRRLVR